MNKLLLILFLLSFTALAETEKIVKSKIGKVTVYQQGAQVYRKASYNASKGINTFIIEGISPNIDPNSLQVNASGQIVLLDSKYSIFYPEPKTVETLPNTIPLKIRKEIQLLNDSIFDMDYKLLEVQYKIDVLNSEKRIIENNGTIKGQGKVNDSIPLLREALELYRLQMNEINSQLLVLSRKQQLFNKEKNQMNARLTKLNNYNSNNQYSPPTNPAPVHRLEITVSAKESTNGKLRISYLVNGAGWTPMYDLRSTASTNSIELTYKAHVFQNTGIDWKGVRLNLSTNNPYANKTKPTLHPWYLDFYNYNQPGYSETQKSRAKTYAGGVHNNAPAKDYNEGLSMEEVDVEAQTAIDFSTLIEQLISVEYAIDLPYTILSDNKKNMVLVNSKKLDTEFMYYTIPKMDLSTYLVARVTDLGELNLIPGKANLFHDGGYLGETWLDPSTMNDTLDLSLGKDPNIQVKRTLLKKECKEKVVGDKVIKTFAYRIEIKNHKNKSVKIIMQDQIPVVRNKDIEIELVEHSKAKLNEITGILNWNIKMKPSESKTFDLSYTVKYDKTKNINLAVH